MTLDRPFCRCNGRCHHWTGLRLCSGACVRHHVRWLAWLSQGDST